MTEYFDRHKKLPFEVQAFTTVQVLSDYAEQHPIDLLLISADYAPDTLGQENIKRVMTLTEEPCEGSMTSAYKYQPAENILEEVLQYYNQEYPRAQSGDSLKRDTKFFAVYSPVKRCGKTGFAIMLGQAMAAKKRVLYMNFEEYPGFLGLLKKEDSDSSELLLHLIQGRDGVYRKLQKLVRPLGYIDYLPPGIGHTDFHELKMEHWERLLEAIRQEEVYDAVILDLGEVRDAIFQIFAYCETVFMPILEDPLSRAKTDEFLWICEGMDCRDKLFPVTPPQENFWEWMEEEKIPKSALYRYAQSMLEG